MDKTFGIGIIGCGVISKTYLDFAPMFKGLEVRAVADIVPEAATARANEYGIAAQSIDELLANPDLDVIINLTIPEVHYQVTKNIILSGKHAYSEKPLVLTVEEGLDLKATANVADLQICCAPDTFLGGSHQQARSIIDAGEIGKITSGTCHVMSPGMESWHPNPDFFFRPGGGPVLDLGPYYIANLINLIGPVSRVTAFANSASDRRTIGSGPRRGETVPVSTPTTIHAILEFTNGAVITLGASWDVMSHGHSPMELYGLQGAIFLADPNFFGGDISIADMNGERSVVQPWDHPFGIANQQQADGGPSRANYRTAGLADMVQAIVAGRQPRCSLDTTLHGVDVMTGILKSAESGMVVAMNTSCERPLALGPKEARSLLR